MQCLKKKGLQPLKDRENLTSGEFIQKAENISMPAWTQIKSMLNETQNYNLPPNIMDQRSLLRKYTDLRIHHTQLWIKAEKENDGTYYRAMDSIAKEIDVVIETISKLQ